MSAPSLQRALELLELPAIVARIRDAVSSEPGATLAAAIEPSWDPDEVRRRQSLTSEAIALLDAAEEPPLHDAADVRDAADAAARGGTLDPPSLGAVARSIGAGLGARSTLVGRDDVPGLATIAARIDDDLGRVASALDRVLDEQATDLRDDASPKLRRLRRELRDGRVRLAERLRALARDPSLREVLSEEFVTERAGRPVLAVRSTTRGAVPGIVHDASGSGRTLFVEPFAVVDDSNRLREAESAERDEVVRILGELSRLVGDHAPSLRMLVEAVAELDLALACAALSRRWRGAPVTTSTRVVLRGARHPLLDPATAIPIDLELGDLRALVISGPNTGGKSVALKTLGLAAILHQCGLRPPADEVELPVFDRILVDMGDDQSIEMSLSTFSAHVRSLIDILGEATDRSLVLLDEVAAGTDPIEGAALGQALLARLAEQARLTVATSHYPELKEWASATRGAANAATALDPETQVPLYRIALGRPGTSDALQTAERLGLAASVVADARERIAPERRRVAELLQEAEAAERAAAEAHAAASKALEDAERERAAARGRGDELAEEIERVRRSAEAERARALAAVTKELVEARAELDALRAEIRGARKLERDRRRATTPASRSIEQERDRRLGAAAERATRAEAAVRGADRALPLVTPLAVGDPVAAPALGVSGTIVELAGEVATVVGRGGLRVRVPVERLQPDRDAPRTSPEPPPVTVRATAPTHGADELDVRGRSAQEAREAVRAFVDQAAVTGRGEVRVVHGRGTGTLRAAVRDELSRHPLVDSSESDSADGATVVRLG